MYIHSVYIFNIPTVFLIMEDAQNNFIETITSKYYTPYKIYSNKKFPGKNK